ncbi:NUDIX hydrolase [Echinicola salinicaeni]|uniref:NUDIX hydrolase n=1 Tax=Echinicola salinicaeni TaxID=2762757 RepID=UPI001647BFB6|nr:NUDIX domain-containing protein [Echinicola salinicaeni]
MDWNNWDCTYRVSIKAFIVNDLGGFLIVREDNGLWDLPGGGLDRGESPKDCIYREINEEMGLKPIKIEPRPMLLFSSNNPKGEPIVNVLYETQLAHLDFTSTTECRELKFIHKKADLHGLTTYQNVLDLVEMIF